MNPVRDIPAIRSVPSTLEAALYNRVRLALLRIANPLELELEQPGIDMVLEQTCWVGYHCQQISLDIAAADRVGWVRYPSQRAKYAGRMHHASVPQPFMAAHAEYIIGHG